jgi:tetratricopeptide (TPR) repeat protein
MNKPSKIILAVAAPLVLLYVVFSLIVFVNKDSGTSNEKHGGSGQPATAPSTPESSAQPAAQPAPAGGDLAATLSDLMNDVRAGNYDTVIATAGKGLAEHPRTAALHYFRGFAYFQKNLPDQAIEDLSAAIEIQPDYPDAYAFRAWAHAAKGELDPALADATKLTELAPRNPDGYLVRGAVYLKKGDKDRARREVTKALELDPGNAKGTALLKDLPAK